MLDSPPRFTDQHPAAATLRVTGWRSWRRRTRSCVSYSRCSATTSGTRDSRVECQAGRLTHRMHTHSSTGWWRNGGVALDHHLRPGSSAGSRRDGIRPGSRRLTACRRASVRGGSLHRAARAASRETRACNCCWTHGRARRSTGPSSRRPQGFQVQPELRQVNVSTRSSRVPKPPGGTTLLVPVRPQVRRVRRRRPWST